MSSNEDAQRDDNEHEELIQDDGFVYYYDPKLDYYLFKDLNFRNEPFVLSDFTYGEKVCPSAEKNSEEKEKENYKHPSDMNVHMVEQDKKREFPADEMWAFPAEDAYEDQPDTDVYAFQLPSDVRKDEVVQVFSTCGRIKQDPEGNPYVKIFIDKKLQSGKKMLRGGKIQINIGKQSGMQSGGKIQSGMQSGGKMQSGMQSGGKIQSSMQSGGVALVRYAWPSSKHLALQHLDGKPLRPGDTVLMSVEQNDGNDDSKENPAIVVLKNMFTLKEIEEDINLPHELENNVRLECSKLGVLKSVKVYENDLEGVIEVKYKNRKDAIKCILLMNGQEYGGKTIVAHEGPEPEFDLFSFSRNQAPE